MILMKECPDSEKRKDRKATQRIFVIGNAPLTPFKSPAQAAAITTMIPTASRAMIKACFSTASSAIRYPTAIASAMRPGHNAARDFSASRVIGSHPLTDLFLDQPGRAPGHDGDDDGKGEDILIGAGEGQKHSPDRLQSGEQETAEDRPVECCRARQ